MSASMLPIYTRKDVEQAIVAALPGLEEQVARRERHIAAAKERDDGKTDIAMLVVWLVEDADKRDAAITFRKAMKDGGFPVLTGSVLKLIERHLPVARMIEDCCGYCAKQEVG